MSMVERVARAIADPILKEFDGFRLDKEVEWDKLPEARDQATLLRIAHAAIGAMLEPTIKMASEGFKEWECATDAGDLDTDAHDMELIWRSMITAALGEGE